MCRILSIAALVHKVPYCDVHFFVNYEQPEAPPQFMTELFPNNISLPILGITHQGLALAARLRMLDIRPFSRELNFLSVE